LNPHSPCGKTDFLARLRLSPPLAIEPKVWGLDYPFTSRILFRLRCCPSSLYTFPSEEPPKGLARDRHVTGFPEFEQFCTAGFPAGTQVFRLSPMRLPIPPRPSAEDRFSVGRTNHSGTVTGTWTAVDILAVPSQHITAGDLAGFVKILNARLGYANVHTTLFPGGEIRGQVT